MPSPVPTSAERTPTHRREAARIVTEVAQRLSQPGRVVEIAGEQDNVMRYPGNAQPVWEPLLLSDGHPGVALLYAELAADRRDLRAPAHAHLTAGLRSGIRRHPQSLFNGMVALAFAAQAAATGFGGYSTMLSGLDGHITEQARERAQADRERLDAGQLLGSWDRYDVLGGTAGVGRYLLARHASAAEEDVREAAGLALREVLRCLVAGATADDHDRHGRRLPSWWVTEGLEHGLVEHLNFGLAHGVTGPLALLSVAWRAGLRVERQDEAIERIMALLSQWRRTDEFGPRWPHLVTLEHLGSGEPPERWRDSWCYGTAGAARAVYLAGAALDRPDWCTDARTALHGALRAASDELIRDSALCHGWSGLLQITLRMAHDSGDPEYHAIADGLAARVVEAFDPGAPFGYRYSHTLAARPLDRPGFLEGAAGIALALHTYASGGMPSTSWDSALLLS